MEWFLLLIFQEVNVKQLTTVESSPQEQEEEPEDDSNLPFIFITKVHS